jgi:hypothetical protein
VTHVIATLQFDAYDSVDAVKLNGECSRKELTKIRRASCFDFLAAITVPRQHGTEVQNTLPP